MRVIFQHFLASQERQQLLLHGKHRHHRLDRSDHQLSGLPFHWSQQLFDVDFASDLYDRDSCVTVELYFFISQMSLKQGQHTQPRLTDKDQGLMLIAKDCDRDIINRYDFDHATTGGDRYQLVLFPTVFQSQSVGVRVEVTEVSDTHLGGHSCSVQGLLGLGESIIGRVPAQESTPQTDVAALVVKCQCQRPLRVTFDQHVIDHTLHQCPGNQTDTQSSSTV